MIQRGIILKPTPKRNSTCNINSEELNHKDVLIDELADKSKNVSIPSKKIEYHNNNIKRPVSANDTLHNNDIKILSLLNQKVGSNYSFKGLMRKLNLHQQSVTRALSRLEDLGFIEKSYFGYKISKTGESIMMLSKNSNLQRIYASQNAEMGLRELGEERNRYVQILQTYLPININTDEILRALIGKWFNNLRWIGLTETESGEDVLQWINYNNDDDNNNNSFQIILKIISKCIIIETNAASDKEKVEAMIGSYRIFEQITKIIGSKVEASDMNISKIGINDYHNTTQFNN